MKEEKVFKLSLQAVGSLMFALQNSLQNETDIVPILEAWDIYEENGELFVKNPPIVEVAPTMDPTILTEDDLEDA